MCSKEFFRAEEPEPMPKADIAFAALGIIVIAALSYAVAMGVILWNA